jgi:aminopeptidase
METLTKPQIERYADVLSWGLATARTKAFKPYDVVLVRYDLPALPLAEALQRRLLDAKRMVVLRALPSPTLERDFFDHSDSRQRRFINAGEVPFHENLAGNIFLSAPESLTHLKHVDPKRIAEVARTRKALRRIMERREQAGLFGWTLCTVPTPELAKQAGMPLADYTKQVVKACYLDDKDPAARWAELYRMSGEIKKWLAGLKIRTVRVESASIDLEVLIGEQRRFLGVSGHNIPSFEIFTSPDWRGTRGTYHADQPSYRDGNLVEGVRLEFVKGRVVKADAKKGADFVRKMAAMDRGAGALGEFSLTDCRFSPIDRFMADTLYDENYGGKYGNCHVALGASYADTYAGAQASLDAAKKKALGFNDSALHWDLVNTEEKRVTATTAGGKSLVIYEKGRFAI